MPATPTRIGIIICSQRTPRAGLQIADWVQQGLQDALNSNEKSETITLNIIDLASWNLPLYNEPGIPSQITNPENYTHEHTRRWSAEIRAHEAFIFVTPQYNWGYPASVKNAIDYLFHEWVGKPAFIVSYGGHGGVKAAEQLRQVLLGVRMRPVERSVALTFPGREFMVKAATGEDLALNRNSGAGDEELWAKEKGEIVQAFREMLALLREKKTGGNGKQ